MKLSNPGNASENSVALNKNGTKNTTDTQGHVSVAPSPTVQITPMRIIFGIQGVRRSLEIEQIEISSQMNDQSFFSELKTRYKKHRAYFQRFLSPFRFRHCNFVKVGLLGLLYKYQRTDCPSSRNLTSIVSFPAARASQILMGLLKTTNIFQGIQ
jgi:hypothetical protein